MLRVDVWEASFRNKLSENDVQKDKELRLHLSSIFLLIQNINVSEDGKDFIRKILVLDPKQRLTVKEMYEHPFLNYEDIPKSIPVDAYHL